jgi:transcription elongation factor GreB
MSEEKNYITPRGFARLNGELERLVKVERVETTKAVAAAAANGDRSENADYIYGKRRLREIDSRIRFLEDRLSNIMIINPTDIKSEKVQFGATVIIADVQGGPRVVRIVGIDEVEVSQGLISWKSPLGSSLLGKKVGDAVVVHSPKGQSEYEILEISYQEIQDKEGL